MEFLESQAGGMRWLFYELPKAIRGWTVTISVLFAIHREYPSDRTFQDIVETTFTDAFQNRRQASQQILSKYWSTNTISIDSLGDTWTNHMAFNGRCSHNAALGRLLLLSFLKLWNHNSHDLLKAKQYTVLFLTESIR